MATNSATKRKRGESVKKDSATEKKKTSLTEDGNGDGEVSQVTSENDALRKRLGEAEQKIAELNETIAKLRSKTSEVESSAEKKEKAPPVPPIPLPLPHELCLEIAKHVHESETLAFALSCRGFRDAMKEALRSRENTVYAYTDEGRKMLLTTRTEHYKKMEGVPVSEEWIKWAFSMKWEYAYEDYEYNQENKEGLLSFLAGRGGFKDVLVWLKSEGCALNRNACSGAARGNHINVLEYLKSEGVDFDSRTCNWAARGGHIHILMYLKSRGVPFDSWTCAWAALGGHLKVLKYLKSKGVPVDVAEDPNGFPSTFSISCSYAAQGGHIKVLKYLKSEGLRFGTETWNGAAEKGHIGVMKYLKSEQGLWFDHGEICYRAACGGQVKVLEWLKSEGVEFDESSCHGAAQEGHLNVLKYLKREGVPFDSGNCSSAAEGGHVNLLEYLKSEGVPFDKDIGWYAAEGGHVNVLKYMKSEGVDFGDEKIWNEAAEQGHLNVLKYLRSEGAVFDSETCRRAAKGGHLEVLKWLRSEEVNCPWNIQECLDVAEESSQEYEGRLGPRFELTAEWISSFLPQP